MHDLACRIHITTKRTLLGRMGSFRNCQSAFTAMALAVLAVVTSKGHS